jgi:hypothetical protein
MGIVDGKAMKFFVRGSTARGSIVYDGEAVSLEADLWLQNAGKKYLLLEDANLISPALQRCVGTYSRRAALR